MKCDAIDGSLVNGLRQPLYYSFVLDKPSDEEVFRESETVHYKKNKTSVLNTITFYTEGSDNKEVNSNGETLIFILQLTKI